MATDSNDARIEEVLAAALNAPDASQRTAILQRFCGSDMKLRQCVEQRLRECEKDLAISNLPHPRPAVTVAHHSSSDSAGGNGFTAAYEPAPLEPPARMVAGRYRLLEHIADGGMGTVWKAEQREPMVRD